MQKLLANYFGNKFCIVICSWRTVDTCPNHIVDHTNPLLWFHFAHWRRFVEFRPSFCNFFFAALWGNFHFAESMLLNKSFASFLIFLLFLSVQNQMVNSNEYLNSSKWVSFTGVVCANADKKKYAEPWVMNGMGASQFTWKTRTLSQWPLRCLTLMRQLRHSVAGNFNQWNSLLARRFAVVLLCWPEPNYLWLCAFSMDFAAGSIRFTQSTNGYDLAMAAKCLAGHRFSFEETAT